MHAFHYHNVRASAGRTSSTWRLKKILASLIAIGALSTVTVTGTFALLTSQETNARSAAASGTLTFSNTVGTGTACLSYNGPANPGNVNTACGALITSSTQNYPGIAITPVKVTIANNGSLDGVALSMYMPSCTVAATPGAPSPGGGNPCAAGGAQFSIQETNSAGVATACRYPSGPVTCVFSANTLQLFAANANTVTSALNLGSGPAHGQSRYFLIGLDLPPTAGNALQGEEAVFALTWHLST